MMNWKNRIVRSFRLISTGLIGLCVVASVSLAIATTSVASTPTTETATATIQQATASAEQQIREQLTQAAIARWPQATVMVDLALVPERLRLSNCNQLKITPRGNRLYGRIPVSIRCTQPKPWQLFVQAQVEVELPVLTVTTNVARGHRLKASDLAYAPRKLHDLRPQFITDTTQALGYLSTRALNAEGVVYSNAIKQPVTVPKGQRVAIAGGQGIIRIAAQGEALEAGMHGDQIKVRNVQSGREVYAWVVGPGRVARHWPNPES